MNGRQLRFFLKTVSRKRDGGKGKQSKSEVVRIDYPQMQRKEKEGG